MNTFTASIEPPWMDSRRVVHQIIRLLAYTIRVLAMQLSHFTLIFSESWAGMAYNGFLKSLFHQ